MGQANDVCALLTESGKCNFDKELADLEKGYRNKVRSALELLGTAGLSGFGKNKRYARDGVWELTPKFGLRVFVFQAPKNANLFVVHSILLKGTNAEQTASIDKAVLCLESLKTEPLELVCI